MSKCAMKQKRVNIQLFKYMCRLDRYNSFYIFTFVRHLRTVSQYRMGVFVREKVETTRHVVPWNGISMLELVRCSVSTSIS